ncbi:hypothetical protein JXA80_08250 [bacterium]|nr:hypothetical protein [candidate division CSSED10-310 bacterium]
MIYTMIRDAGDMTFDPEAAALRDAGGQPADWTHRETRLRKSYRELLKSMRSNSL